MGPGNIFGNVLDLFIFVDNVHHRSIMKADDLAQKFPKQIGFACVKSLYLLCYWYYVLLLMLLGSSRKSY